MREVFLPAAILVLTLGAIGVQAQAETFQVDRSSFTEELVSSAIYLRKIEIMPLQNGEIRLGLICQDASCDWTSIVYNGKRYNSLTLWGKENMSILVHYEIIIPESVKTQKYDLGIEISSSGYRRVIPVSILPKYGYDSLGDVVSGAEGFLGREITRVERLGFVIYGWTIVVFVTLSIMGGLLVKFVVFK